MAPPPPWCSVPCTPNEIAWVKELWPEHQSYLDVYHDYQLTGERSLFAHGIHLEDKEWQCLHDTGSAVAFCPTSNLFLGSGLFRLPTCWQKKVRMGIGTDVGAGTTTALVFCTLHPESVNALFSEALRFNMRLIAGKVMMDRNTPDYLTETAEQSYQQTRELIQRWQHQGRLGYAITPRFAPTSTPELLSAVRQLREEFPETWLHTHLSENPNEIAWVKELWPEHQSYLDVYHDYQLTGERSLFAHGIHLEDKEWQCLHDTGSAVAFCPTSNLFLGSGLFRLPTCWQKKVRMGIGTDVGAGTTFSMFKTLGEAYKVAQLQSYRLRASEAFYHATLGGAHALRLDDKIGNFQPGKEADFIVVDPAATPLQRLRVSRCKDVYEQLFVLMTMGDERNISETWVNGECVWRG